MAKVEDVIHVSESQLCGHWLLYVHLTHLTLSSMSFVQQLLPVNRCDRSGKRTSGDKHLKRLLAETVGLMSVFALVLYTRLMTFCRQIVA